MEEPASRDTTQSGAFWAASSRNRGRPSAGHLLGGRYEIQEEIGSGTFSITWRGLDRRLGRIVAIKILRREYALDPTYVQRFEREARTAASVSHQNVVDVYDYGQHGELLYIVMQYIEGEDLKHLIAREGPLPLNRVAQITRDVLSGLAAIHEAGIIHRDIKPQNILIGRHGRARVADFGVARVADDGRLTSVGTTVGSASYMAPEQAQGGELTPATDLYAVGVVLHEMLTGRLPFEAPTTMALLLAHIQEAPIPPSYAALDQYIPPSFDRLVMRALAKQPHNRFASAAAMRRELAAAMDEADAQERTTHAMAAAASGEQSRPAWPSPMVRRDAGQRRITKRPRTLVLALLLLLLVVAGALAGRWAVLNEDNDDPMTEIARAPLVAAPSPTATTSAAAATEEMAPVDLTFSRTETLPEATDAPTETPAPTTAPTETPEPTEAPTPTEAPVPTETPEPTLPPTESANPIEPIGVPDGEDAVSGEDLSVIDQQGNTEEIQRIATDAPTASENEQTGTVMLEFSASDWQGAYYQETGNLQPWSAIYGQGSGYESGSLRVDLPGQPASGTFALSVQGMTSENWSSLPMAIRVNGQEVFSGNSPFPTWNGVDGEQPWGTATFELPASAFQQGENTITFVNLAGQGAFGLPPYILLASGTLTGEIARAGNGQAYFDIPAQEVAIEGRGDQSQEILARWIA